VFTITINAAPFAPFKEIQGIALSGILSSGTLGLIECGPRNAPRGITISVTADLFVLTLRSGCLSYNYALLSSGLYLGLHLGEFGRFGRFTTHKVFYLKFSGFLVAVAE
jgi:hypothetical protein